MTADAGLPDLGRYRLGRLLGRGGMGEVYLAHDLELGRDVAIKFVSEDKVSDAASRRRLLHEAHAAAALDHPCICTVYETGQTPDGKAFIVMQYVEGEPLSSVLQAGRLPVRDALSLAAAIADALGAAHRRGFVHRDLKPSNVMVTPSGRPKLLDFGIAKQVVAAAASDAPTSSDATASGAIIGTPAYMSPEQIQQRPLDGRSDLFSLGALLFESLTGRRAFEGRNAIETIANVLHVHPPDASTLRQELTERHDELCRRLLAKSADDRFQSADEVVGAIRLLLPDTSRTPAPAGDVPAPMPPRMRISRRALISAAALFAATILGLKLWGGTRPLPAVPPDAAVWYQRGLAAIREGSYETARRAFEQAVAIFPQHVLAYVRLADSHAELDNDRAAKEQLLRVSQLVPDESRLPTIERLRVQAIRAAVLRDVDGAIDLYRQLAEQQPDAGPWVDLGRAQEAAGLRTDARQSFERAIAADKQYAAAYLRLGYVEGLESRRTEAMAAFGEAERLFRAASEVEGETEVLLRRGELQDAAGELRFARTDLERAIALATSSRSPVQQLRARLMLSRVMASEGRLSDAEKSATRTVQDALEQGLEIVAADSLIDLAATLQQLNRPADAEQQIRRAIQLAEQRGARRTIARARLQLASWEEAEGRSTEALTLVGSVLPFVSANRYRRLELDALQIASRAHQSLDQLEKARQMSSQVLTLAETLKDEPSVALASTNLASVTTALGNYPDALRFRLRAEAIHRRQGDNASLPFDLANRADLLIRLGRRDEAAVALDELDAGRAAGLEAYVGRGRRAVYLRGASAITAMRCDEALTQLASVKWDDGTDDTAAVLAPALETFCRARLGRPPAPPFMSRDLGPAITRERSYWLAAAALAHGDGQRALAAATEGLMLLRKLPNDELQWRLAAVGCVAAARLGDGGRRDELRGVAIKSRESVKSQWKADFDTYDKRADVVHLVRLAGLD